MGKKIKKQRRILGWSSLELAGLLGCMVACPSMSQAEAIDTSAFSAEVATKTSVKAYATISVALDSAVGIDLVPKSGGTFNSSSARLQVGTNNTSGYSIFLHTADGSQDLSAVNDKNNGRITAINGTMSANNFKDNLNTWGFALTSGKVADTSTVYRAIPKAGDAAIKTTDTTSGQDTYYLNIGAAIDPSLPAGEYRNSVVVSVVANQIVISGFRQIYYMQEMTPQICASADLYEEGQLVDRRDNKIYTVAKLTNDTCWMTQNLALDLSTEVVLTPEDSDVSAEWRPTVDTQTALSQSDDPNGTESWHLENAAGSQWYYQWNAATAGTGSNAIVDGATASDSICPKGWTLPLDGGTDATIKGSFRGLMGAYNLSNETGGTTLTQPPINFVRAGNVIANQGIQTHIGNGAFLWSKSASSKSTAYAMFVNGQSIVQPGSHSRLNGFSVRCITTVLAE